MSKHEEVKDGVVFPRGDLVENSPNFTKKVWLKMLVANDEVYHCPIGDVIFEPGCINSWHKHANGQILLVTGGHGYYQIEGQPAVQLKKGDVVKIPPNTKHWHGASHDSWFSHIAITPFGTTEWLEPVNPKEYEDLKKGDK